MGQTLVVGKSGQLAQALAYVSDTPLSFRGGQDHDFFNVDATARLIDDLNIRRVLNTAAYTAVDQAESEPGAARQLNTHLPLAIAKACSQTSARLIHISTDYVFDGQKEIGQHYKPEDETNPINVYGQTKLDGEYAVLDTLKDASIVRTSWVISQFGKNFLKTMARLMREGKDLRVVNDQWGTPTLATDLARHLISGVPEGISHHATGAQQTWFNLAKTIQAGLDTNVTLSPIPTDDYPTPAKRGRNTSLVQDAKPEFIPSLSEVIAELN